MKNENTAKKKEYENLRIVSLDGSQIYRRADGRCGLAPLAAFLTQSCSLRSVTLTSTYRRSLISSLQDIINVSLNG